MTEGVKGHFALLKNRREGDELFDAPPRKRGKVRHGTDVLAKILEMVRSKNLDYLKMLPAFVTHVSKEIALSHLMSIFDLLVSLLDRDPSPLQAGLSSALVAFTSLVSTKQRAGNVSLSLKLNSRIEVSMSQFLHKQFGIVSGSTQSTR